jgi:hypothetical protein
VGLSSHEMGRGRGTSRALPHSEYQHGRLSDDATIVLLEWRPGPLL